MSFTKLSLAQQALKRTHPSLTKDSKISLREMMYAVGQARDKVTAASIWSAYSVGEAFTYDGSITTFTDVSVIKEDECLYYFELPAKPLNLPNNMGMYQIISNNNRRDAFVPVKSTFYSMYSDSIVQGLETQKGYWQEGSKIYLTSTELSEDTKLIVQEICESDGIGPDDYFPLQPDLEEAVIQEAIKSFALTFKMPEDNRTDNAHQMEING